MKTWKVWLACVALAASQAAQAQSSTVTPGSRISYSTEPEVQTQVFDAAAPVIRDISGSGSEGDRYRARLLADHLSHTLRVFLGAGSLNSFGAFASYQYQFTAPPGDGHTFLSATLRVDGLISALGSLGATRIDAFFGVRDLDTTEVIFDPVTGTPSLNTDLATFRLSMAQDVFLDDDGTRVNQREGSWSLVTNVGPGNQRDIPGGAFDTDLLNVNFTARSGSVVTVFGYLAVFAGAGGEGPIAVTADLSRTFSADVFDAQGQQIDLPGVRNFDGSLTAPVPEPHTWALWLSGLLGLGQVLRRRRAD